MSKEQEKNQIVIHNVKSADYRQAHADGASVGITPSGYFNLNFYGQRASIPKSTIFNINPDGSLGDLVGISEDSKEGIIREYEFGVYLDINTCLSLKKVLEEKISEYYRLTQQDKSI